MAPRLMGGTGQGSQMTKKKKQKGKSPQRSTKPTTSGEYAVTATASAGTRAPRASSGGTSGGDHSDNQAGSSASASSGFVRPTRDWRTIIVGAAVSLAALLLYLMTAARDVMTLDTPDYLIAAKTLGVAHPPGFPLLDFLGYLFTWLPVGSTAFRIDLLAVLCSTATVALVYATVWRLVNLRTPAAAAGLALAFTPLFWRWSLQAEIFPLNNLLVVLTIYLLVRWHQNPSNHKYIVGGALAFGLAVFCQGTAVLLIPAIVWMLWLHRKELNEQRKIVVYAVVAFLCGSLPYLYVPLVAAGHSPINWDYVRSVSSFMRLVLRDDFGGPLSQGATGPTGSNGAVRLVYMIRGIGVVIGVSSVIGMVYSFVRIRWYFWFVALAFGFTGVIYLFATDLDPTTEFGYLILERFFLLPLVIIAPLVGLGVTWIGEKLSELSPVADPKKGIAAATAGVLIISLVIVGINYSTVNVSNDHVEGNFARDALSELPPHTILFATGDETTTPEIYMTSAAGVRPDVTVLYANYLGTSWYPQVLRHNGEIHVPAHVSTLSIIRANPGRPVAFIGPPPDTSLNGKFYLYPDGLVSFLERDGHPIPVTRDETNNEAQLARLHIPNYSSIKWDSLEPVILAHYANIPYRIGQAYALSDQNSKAIFWYRKALAIDPKVTLPAKAIRRLGGTP